MSKEELDPKALLSSCPEFGELERRPPNRRFGEEFSRLILEDDWDPTSGVLGHPVEQKCIDPKPPVD